MILPSPKRFFVDMYLRHVMRRAEKNADAIREMQKEAKRTDEMVLRIDAFEADVRKRGFIEQGLMTRYFRVTDGRLEMLDGGQSKFDVSVMTDVPTLWGFANGQMDEMRPDGSMKVVRPFTPRDAVRKGRLIADGPASVLTNLFLLERTVLPRLADELRLPKPPDR